jgi:putative ABC transport system permease protein
MGDIRTGRDPVPTVSLVKQAIERLGPGRPLYDMRRLESNFADAAADARFALFVLGVLSMLAIVLTSVGIYGIVAYATARRAREIAVRLALGAGAHGLVVSVMRGALVRTIAGLAVGIAGALRSRGTYRRCCSTSANTIR